jgi:hypothetical protein
VTFTKEQTGTIYTIGLGGMLTVLTCRAGAGKTALLLPLVAAWKDAGRALVGTAASWRHTEALKDAGIKHTWAMRQLSNALEIDQFRLTAATVLIVDQANLIPSRTLLMLLKLQTKTGMTITMIDDPDQALSMETAGAIN